MYVSFRGIRLYTLFYFSHSSNLLTFLCSFLSFFSFLLKLERTGIYSDSFNFASRVVSYACVSIHAFDG